MNKVDKEYIDISIQLIIITQYILGFSFLETGSIKYVIPVKMSGITQNRNKIPQAHSQFINMATYIKINATIVLHLTDFFILKYKK